MLPRRAWDNSGKRFGSPAKAERELGFRTGIDLERGCERTVAWTRDNLALIRRHHGKARGETESRMNAPATDAANAVFWNELCGSSFARALGIKDHSIASLQRFDRAYLDLYPYLLQHVPVHTMRGQSVLEIGLGYGTLGQQIAAAGADYTGLDIAAGPVDDDEPPPADAGLPGKAMQGSMLECPLPDGSMDCVVSIGCFHHTGNLQRCIDETWRVLVRADALSSWSTTGSRTASGCAGRA